jgi:tRNA G10  N-methylase Trm11
MADAVVVEGLTDLQRAFKAADVSVQRELRKALRLAAEPVRADAERLAVAGIPRIGTPWSRMRVGVTNREVYLAPRERGQKGRDQRLRRPNLRALLLQRSMEPALAQNTAAVMAGVDVALATVGRVWEEV